MNIEPSEIFKVLGVETRIRIINLLKTKGPLGANEIAERVGITPAAVSQHLKILKQVGLVRSERKGYWIPYSIDETAMENCRRELNKICTCGCKGTGKFREVQLNKSDLATLKKYEKEIEDELRLVRERMNEIESQNKI